MANACDLCGKKRDVGHNVSHAKNRTQRIRKPNLHAHRMQIPASPSATQGTGTTSLRLKLCTKCLRTVKAGAVAPAVPAIGTA